MGPLGSKEERMTRAQEKVKDIKHKEAREKDSNKETSKLACNESWLDLVKPVMNWMRSGKLLVFDTNGRPTDGVDGAADKKLHRTRKRHAICS